MQFAPTAPPRRGPPDETQRPGRCPGRLARIGTQPVDVKATDGLPRRFGMHIVEMPSYRGMLLCQGRGRRPVSCLRPRRLQSSCTTAVGVPETGPRATAHGRPRQAPNYRDMWTPGGCVMLYAVSTYTVSDGSGVPAPSHPLSRPISWCKSLGKSRPFSLCRPKRPRECYPPESDKAVVALPRPWRGVPFASSSQGPAWQGYLAI